MRHDHHHRSTIPRLLATPNPATPIPTRSLFNPNVLGLEHPYHYCIHLCSGLLCYYEQEVRAGGPGEGGGGEARAGGEGRAAGAMALPWHAPLLSAGTQTTQMPCQLSCWSGQFALGAPPPSVLHAVASNPPPPPKLSVLPSVQYDQAIEKFESGQEVAELVSRGTLDVRARRNAAACLNNKGACHSVRARVRWCYCSREQGADRYTLGE